MAHEKAHRHLAASDPRMAALIKRSLRFNLKPGKSIRPFDALAESIAYQQLSGKAAATIWKRVRALYPRKKHLDPKEILKTPDEKLRGAGLSRSKVAALKDLAAAGVNCAPIIDRTRPTTNKNAILSNGYNLLKIDTVDNTNGTLPEHEKC